MTNTRPSRLSRLSSEYYQGYAWVHWVVTTEGRRKGWLDARFYYRFRELLTHTAFRYQIACPIFCLMPDHVHLLWTGLAKSTNQLLGMQSFRRDLNSSLRQINFELQRQSYDHVLKESELVEQAIEQTAEYIARNPERQGLIPTDRFCEYPFIGCLMPGASQLQPFRDTTWDEVWRTLAFLRRTECFRITDDKYIRNQCRPERP